MVAWAERVPGKLYPAWWADGKRVLARRLKELSFVHPLTETHGLPKGMRVERDSWKAMRDVFVVYDEGVKVHQRSNLIPGAAEDVAEWIELYQKECEDIMDVSVNGLGLLKTLAANEGSMARTALEYHGTVIAALAKKKLIRAKDDRVEITSEGIAVLKELPEFDEPTSPQVSLLEERGENTADAAEEAAYMAAAALSVEEFTQAIEAAAVMVDEGARRFALDEKIAELQQAMDMNDKLIKLVIVDDLGLHNFVEHCGSEITVMGGTVIKLELKEALLREVFPPLAQYLAGLDAIGAEYVVFGDLQIVVEQPINEDDPIPYELR